MFLIGYETNERFYRPYDQTLDADDNIMAICLFQLLFLTENSAHSA